MISDARTPTRGSASRTRRASSGGDLVLLEGVDQLLPGDGTPLEPDGRLLTDLQASASAIHLVGGPKLHVLVADRTDPRPEGASTVASGRVTDAIVWGHAVEEFDGRLTDHDAGHQLLGGHRGLRSRLRVGEGAKLNAATLAKSRKKATSSLYCRHMIIIAHNIRSLYNVGSIFRNAAAFGVEKLYLTGITAAPPRKEIAKVALGAQDLVDWEQGDVAHVIELLRRQDYKVYGLETGEGSVPIDQIDASQPMALVLGNEVDGIDIDTLELLDGTIEIPMGKKRSLNVSVASGIALYVLS